MANGKNLQQKNFNNLVWTSLGSKVNIYINSCLQVHFKVSAANLPPVLLIPVAICHRRRRYRGYQWQICHRCRWHRRCTLTCEYLREFSKKFEMTLMLFLGAWGKVIHEKNLKQKISWHCPFKEHHSTIRAHEAHFTCDHLTITLKYVMSQLVLNLPFAPSWF